MFTREQIAAAVARPSHESAVVFRATPLHASVAMVLAEGADGFDLCFMRRAERAGDPWSGHVSFPGGRAEPRDASARAVAERETYEEVGMSLRPSHRVGELPVLPHVRRGVTVYPFVYVVDQEIRGQANARQPEEVASVFWVPLTHLFADANVTKLDYCLDGHQQQFPGVQYDEHVIWGLTLHLAHSLARRLGQSFPALD